MDPRPVLFFDIDNCLYPKSTGIALLMKERIYKYGQRIGIPEQEVIHLCETYYREYGLAIRGLLKHHIIDPADYDAQVDGTLPLEEILNKDPELRAMLQATTARRVAFTNAGRNHAVRVLRCLDVIDLFEELVYCEYADPNFTCKPEKESFMRAMRRAQVTDPQLCYFVDDSLDNVKMAKALGWHAVHLDPEGTTTDPNIQCITDILQLCEAFPGLW
ncbi:putative suppressor of disruption of TFIIS [Dispira simplex]|nr:putative suppressor of disruption of TFIIS [Dispira simplex]